MWEFWVQSAGTPDQVALDVAQTASVDIEYIAADYGEYEDDSREESYDIAYAGILKGADQSTMPQCLLRYWTIREVVSAIASAGFRIEGMTERGEQGYAERWRSADV